MNRPATEEMKELFTQYYSRYYNEFYRYAYYFMGNAEDAEDAVADAIVSAYSAFSALRDTSKFKFWFLKILQNNCKSKLKGKVVPLSIESEYENGMDIPDTTTDMELTAAMKQLLETLTATDRSIVLLCVLGGYSSEEVGQITGISAGNVRVRLHRALGALRRSIAAQPTTGGK